MIETQEEITGVSAPPRAISWVFASLWAARGFFGGLAAIGLAVLGQVALLRPEGQSVAGPYYLAAITVLIASLVRPNFKRHSKAESEISPHSASRIPHSTFGSFRIPHSAFRIRVAAGLALAAALAGASLWLLLENMDNPLGGWLWAGSLLALLVTFLGVEGRPRGEGLMPDPRSDFFSKGLPTIPARWEAITLGIVFVVALALRLYNLEAHPYIIGDEGERGVAARTINEGEPANIFGYGWWSVPNLYFYCVAWMIRLFGDNLTGSRMLSVVSGMLMIWFVYRSTRLLWGPRAGLLAGALLAVSPLVVQLSRLVTEATPTAMLWAGGFYFLFMALYHRRMSDWVLAGMLWGLNLYFYASGKLIIPVAAIVGLYCLVRWRANFFKRYALGFLLAAVALGITFMPGIVFGFKDNWQGVTLRARETSLFTPEYQLETFTKYGIPFEKDWVDQAPLQSITTHPMEWALLLFHQARVTLEVMNYKGHLVEVYDISAHGGSMLPPLYAAITMLGLAYAAWKSGDARFAITNIWFWGGMMGAILTVYAPNVQRTAAAWPAAAIFPAVLLDRILAAAWPLNLNLARRWITVPLVGLLAFFTGDTYNEYFNHFTSLHSRYWMTQGLYSRALGQEYKAYQLGVSDNTPYFNYGTSRFLAKHVEGEDLFVPVDFLPITDNKGKGAAFIVLPTNEHYLPLIRLFYPGGKLEAVKDAKGIEHFISYKLTHSQLAKYQTSHATYTSMDGRTVKREEPNLGAGNAIKEWAPPAELKYPAQASWQSGLIAPAYGLYTFQITGSNNARLEVDGKAILEAGDQAGSFEGVKTNIVLAKGVHTINFSGTLEGSLARPEVRWGGAGSPASLMTPMYLFNGSIGGLSAEVGAYTSMGTLNSGDPFKGKADPERRTYPAIGFRVATMSLGNTPLAVRWRGVLQAPVEGVYEFEMLSSGPSTMLIDGRVVMSSKVEEANTPPVTSTLTLSAGPHDVDLRYGLVGGMSMMEWFWTPPGGKRALVPPDALTPYARNWPPSDMKNPPSPRVQTEAEARSKPSKLAPDAVIGAKDDLLQPRGVGVDAKGNIYVGDKGHERIVVYAPDGKIVHTWDAALPPNAKGDLTEGFQAINDLAVQGDGTVFVIDTLGNVLVFSGTGKYQRAIDPHKLGMYNPSGISVGRDGSLYVADTGQGRVLKIRPGGRGEPLSITGRKEGESVAFGIKEPLDVAAAPQDDSQVYVIDSGSRLARLSQDGAILEQWRVTLGNTEGGSRMAVSPDGKRIYITEPERHRIGVTDLAKGITEYFGEEGKKPGQFNLPTGIAVGPDGRVYVADGNNVVQVFTVK